ncbi:MAG: hypothetical protein KF718_07260 [Polyangiaceae bacterium]|nr:hypothetical protein [Polyangiaceae bacterium]
MADDPKKSSAQENLDEIPIAKTKPTTIIAVVGVVVVLGGVVGVKALSGGKKKAAPVAESTAQADDPLAGMSPEERKRHLEITRKSLENWQAAETVKEAERKAAAEEAKRKAEEEERAKTAAAAPAGGGGPAPAAPVNKAAAKKQSSALDDLASDITGKLGGK